VSERQTGATVYVATTFDKHGDTPQGVFATEAEALKCLAELPDWRYSDDVLELDLPPGQVIADAERVPTDDEIRAIRAIVADDGVPAESAEWFAAFDTLRAYLERQR